MTRGIPFEGAKVVGAQAGLGVGKDLDVVLHVPAAQPRKLRERSAAGPVAIRVSINDYKQSGGPFEQPS
jgi:hypothetical protein